MDLAHGFTAGVPCFEIHQIYNGSRSPPTLAPSVSVLRTQCAVDSLEPFPKWGYSFHSVEGNTTTSGGREVFAGKASPCAIYRTTSTKNRSGPVMHDSCYVLRRRVGADMVN